jgi:hypothetical protein
VARKNQKLLRNLEFSGGHPEHANFRVAPCSKLTFRVGTPPPDKILYLFVKHGIDLKV